MRNVTISLLRLAGAGLAAAHAARAAGHEPVVLEAGSEPVGSWPAYYDSLRLFSPARYSGLPSTPFPGDPDRYPARDEVVDYLRCYAKALDADIRTGSRVTEVVTVGRGFSVRLSDGTTLTARTVIAATGSFGRPHRPELPGLERYTGTVLHAADYRSPHSFAGQRVVVVGAGNSAVQIAVELAEHARVTLATRSPIRYATQRPLGRDLHFWLTMSGLDGLPVGPLLRRHPTVPVLDDGVYRQAVNSNRPNRQPLFTAADGTDIMWPDGRREHVDTILLATGYRPDLGYLRPLGALSPNSLPLHTKGISTAHPGLGYVGLEWQRSLASATLRGVGRDARFVVARERAR